MASKKTKSEPDAKEKRRQTIHEMMSRAREAREESKHLIEAVRTSPELADEVREMLCEDLRRVYSIPRDILGPSASRDRYREHGHYSTSLVTYLFGQWAQFQREAKIETVDERGRPTGPKYESLGERKVQHNISKTLRAQTVARYAEEHVKPWDGAYNSLDMTQEKVVLQIGSDFHSKYLDPFARRVWLEVADDAEPDGVRYNGDGPDFPQLSRHRQLPGHFALTVQDEIDCWRQFMADTREVVPDADCKWILGNHDIRLITAMAEAFPIFASVRNNRFHELFDLDGLRTGLVARASFLNPTAKMRKNDIAQNWETLPDAHGNDFWTTVHGFLCGKDAPRKHLDRFMTFGTNGHLHDPACVSGGSLATGPLRWWQTGCMAWPEAIASGYIPGPVEATGWFTQFIVVSLFPHTRHVHVEEVTVGETAAFRDWHWEITDEERAARAEMLEI